MTEAKFQAEVMALARDHRWLVYHAVPCAVRPGRWVTSQAGHKGFPDLVLAHPDRGTLFVELKTDEGIVSPEQTRWHLTLTASGAEAVIWRPTDWPIITDRLTKDTPT